VCLRPVLRPRRDRRARPYDAVGTAPIMTTTKAPATNNLSGLNRTALALAVYASQCPLPEHHARLASRCWPLCGTGLVTRRILTKGFRQSSSSSPKLTWRKVMPYSDTNEGRPLPASVAFTFCPDASSARRGFFLSGDWRRKAGFPFSGSWGTLLGFVRWETVPRL
jgi:hypothetical protein